MTEEPARSDAPTARIKKLLGPNFLFRWQIPGEHGTAQTPAKETEGKRVSFMVSWEPATG